MSNGDIVLTAGIRQNLLSLQNTRRAQQTTQQRSPPARRSIRPSTTPLTTFTAGSLTSRAGELSSLLDAMTNGKTRSKPRQRPELDHHDHPADQATAPRRGRTPPGELVFLARRHHDRTAALKTISFSGGLSGDPVARQPE